MGLFLWAGLCHAEQSGPTLSDLLDSILLPDSETKTHSNHDLNYRFTLPEGFKKKDVSELIPGADLGASTADGKVFFAVVGERLGVNMSPKEYDEVILSAIAEKLAGIPDSEIVSQKPLELDLKLGDLDAARRLYTARLNNRDYEYVNIIASHNGFAYQIIGWKRKTVIHDLAQYSHQFASGFELIDQNVRADHAKRKSVAAYTSTTFGYRLEVDDKEWFQWMDKENGVAVADIAALSNRGAGMVMIPVCWDEKLEPRQSAVRESLFAELGLDEVDDILKSEEPVEKQHATGHRYTGSRFVEGDEFFYKLWLVQTESCSYLLAVWTVDNPAPLEKLANPFWNGLAFLAKADASEHQFLDKGEQANNATLVNRVGLRYYETRNYRTAFEYFDYAYQQLQDASYFTNGLQALSDLQAYEEAYRWGKDKFDQHDDPAVTSWHAWLVSANDQQEKSVQLYRELFTADHVNDEDFTIYARLLAEQELWEELDSLFDGYPGIESKTDLKRLRATLFAQQKKFAEALKILQQLESKSRFDADLSYTKLDVLREMGNYDEVYAESSLLIEKGYGSAEAFYYQGDALYQLSRFDEAKTSMQKALEFAPRNKNILEYLRDISAAMGEGDNSALLSKIEPVDLPSSLAKAFDSADYGLDHDGFDSFYLNRYTGYYYSDSKPLRKTFYSQIKIQNETGVERFGTLEHDFNPTYEKVFINDLRVFDEKGDLVAEGDPKDYYVADKSSDQASFDKTAYLPVPSLSPGHTIRFVLSVEERGASDDFPVDRFVFSSDRPVGSSALFLTGETDSIEYVTSKVEPREEGDALVWMREDPIVFRWEPMLPDYENILQWVQLGKVQTSWKSVAEDYLDEIEGKLQFERVKNKAESLIRGIDDPARQVEILARYVQREINYKALEFGRRAIIPKTARETMRDRYGDCKDHSTLLYALLSAVRIDAYLALVNSSQSVNADLPHLDQFNHVVVYVPGVLGGVYIDTTDKDYAFSTSPPRGLAGSYALLLDRDNPDLVKIPDYGEDSSRLKITRSVTLASSNRAKINEYAQFSGYVAADLRGQLKGIETAQLKDRLQNWLSDQYADAELDDFFVENVFEPESDLFLELSYSLPGQGSLETPVFLEKEYLEQTRFPDKQFPFQVRHPFVLVSTTRIESDGKAYSLPDLKDELTGTSDFGSWKREARTADGDFELVFEYAINDGRYTAKRYSDYHRFHRGLLEKLPVKVTLE